MNADEQNGRAPLTVIILTRNERENIGPCLSYLRWADEVILVDSFSSDDTVERALAERPDAKAFRNRFEDFGQQRNWALDHTQPKHDWILFLDADERCNSECAAAIRVAIADPGRNVGFFLCYRNYFLGRWIKHCTMFPSWQLRLLKRGEVRYRKEGHGQREVTSGALGYISAPYDHLDLSKGLADWLDKHNAYTTQEVELILRLAREPLRMTDLFKSPIERRRCMKRLAARLRYGRIMRFFYIYVLRGGFLDGEAGLVYCLLRASLEIDVIAKLKEAEMLSRSSTSPVGKRATGDAPSVPAANASQAVR